MSDERSSAEIYRIIEEGPGFTVKRLILSEGLSQEIANEAYKEIRIFFDDETTSIISVWQSPCIGFFSSKKP